MRLQGKRAFVTAAGAGIGQATARAFAAEGAEVIATDLDGDALAPLAAEGMTTRPLDATDGAAVRAAIEAAGRIDVLFHAVGIVHHGTILDCDEADFDLSTEVNTKAFYHVARAALPGMVSAGGGSIIAVASAASSLMAVPNRFVYGGTKAAVIGMVKSIAADFVTKGIRANAICPGTVESPSWHERVRKQGEAIGDVEKARRDFIARQPMGRIGTADEIAALAVYLAAEESAFMTGQSLAIDGGMTNT